MQNKTLITIIIGGLFIIAYCIVTASSSVLVNYAEGMFGPVVLLAYSFFLSAVFFNLANIKKYPAIIGMYRNNLKLVFYLNLSTAITWLATFYGLDYAQPDIFVGLAYGFLTISATILTISPEKSSKLIKTEFFFAGLIFLIMIGLSIDDIFVASNLSIVFYSVGFAAVMGFAGAFAIIYQHQLAAKKYTASQVLAVRFNLLIFATVFLMIDKGFHLSLVFSWWYLVIAVALTSVMLPLYFLQKGIERIDPVFVTFIIPFVPIMTFIIELFNPKYSFSWAQLILLSILAAILCAASYAKMQLMKK